MTRMFALLALGVLAVGCSRSSPKVSLAGASASVPGRATSTTRTALPVRWNTQLTIAAPRATAEWQPLWVAAGANGEYVFDDASGLLYAFDNAGRPRWHVGDLRKNGGRFQVVRDLREGPDHRIWVLDVGTTSISVVDTSGSVVRRIPLDSVGYCEKILPLANGDFVAWRSDDSMPFALVNQQGHVVRTARFPWSGYAALPGVSRFGSMASDTGNSWSFAFSDGDGWFAFDSMTARPFAGHFVEPVAFPAVLKIVEGRRTTWKLPHRTMAALATSLDADHLYVVFGGQGPDRARRIDLYDPHSGRYQGTWPLPFAVNEVSRAGNRWTFITRGASPKVVVMTADGAAQPRAGT